jgi:xylulokinase
MEALLLGIDVGTTNSKVVLATPIGRVVAQAQSAHDTHHPKAGWAEQRSEDWWQGVVTATQQIINETKIDVKQIAGIGVSGQGCAVTLIGKNKNVLRPAIIWMDSRAESQCECLRQTCADLLFQKNGKQPAPYNADPSLMWLKEHEPKTIERACVSLTSTAFINWKLTGNPVANHSDSSILFAYDLHENTWSDELINAFDLPLNLYPKLAASTEVIGTLQGEAAGELGLPEGIPVVAGGEDTSSAAIANGVTEAGEVSLSLGTAGTIYSVTNQVEMHPQLLTFAHVLPKRYLVGGSTNAVGAAFTWIKKQLDVPSNEELSALAGKSTAGANGVIFLPYLSGELQPVNDGNARAVFFGLSSSTTKADMARAVLEGTVYALAHNLALIRELGIIPQKLHAVGGPTKSKLWCQIAANVMGVPVHVLEDAGAPVGNALLAAQGVGLIDDAAETARHNLKVQRSYEPNPAETERYRDSFTLYQNLYPALRSSFASQARWESRWL